MSSQCQGTLPYLGFLPRVLIKPLPQRSGEDVLEALECLRGYKPETPAALQPGVTDIIPSQRQHLCRPPLVHVGRDLVGQHLALLARSDHPVIKSARRILHDLGGYICLFDKEPSITIPEV